jgi:predicted class III extradiol MEMO1 family dioxygenase
MPKIIARFVVDDQGRPNVHVSSMRHYEIELSMQELDEDVYSVTYVLDESYYDQVNETRERPDFPLHITSYGDYEIKAIIRSKKSTDAATASLYHALRMTHATEKDKEIQTALKYVREH